MDPAYDAGSIHAHSGQLNHAPIIAPYPRRATKEAFADAEHIPDQPTPQRTWAQQARYKTRTMSERVNARLKDEFGASQIRVRGSGSQSQSRQPRSKFLRTGQSGLTILELAVGASGPTAGASFSILKA